MSAVTAVTAVDYRARANLTRKLVLLCYWGLLALFAYITLLAPSHGRAANPAVWLLLSLPLLVFVRGVSRGDPRSHTLLCFVCLLYFCVTVVNLFAPSPGIMPIIELVLVVGLFISAMLYARWQSRAMAAEQTVE